MDVFVSDWESPTPAHRRLRIDTPPSLPPSHPIYSQLHKKTTGWKQLDSKRGTHAWIGEGFDAQFIPETSAGSINIWPGCEGCMKGDEYVVKDPKRLRPGKHGTLEEMLKMLSPAVLSKSFQRTPGHLSLLHTHTHTHTHRRAQALTLRLTLSITLVL